MVDAARMLCVRTSTPSFLRLVAPHTHLKRMWNAQQTDCNHITNAEQTHRQRSGSAWATCGWWAFGLARNIWPTVYTYGRRVLALKNRWAIVRRPLKHYVMHWIIVEGLVGYSWTTCWTRLGQSLNPFWVLDNVWTTWGRPLGTDCFNPGDICTNCDTVCLDRCARYSLYVPPTLHQCWIFTLYKAWLLCRCCINIKS